MQTTLPPPSAQEENITKRALHLRLKFEKLGNSRKVKTSEVDIGDADENLVRVSKKLLDSPELMVIGSKDGELKKFVGLVCLPFPDPGMRLVPFRAVERVTKRLREYAIERPLLVESFMQVYKTETERAQTRLGHLFNAKDYPPAEAVRKEFSFSYEFVSFGPPEELSAIDPELFEEERQKARATMRSAAELGQTFLLTKFTEMIERLKTQLTPAEDGKKRKLYDTAVTNLQEFISNFDMLNINNYRELESEVERAKRAVASINMDQIRESDNLRQYVTKEMGEIESTLQSLVTTRTRKFKLQDVQ